MSPFSASARRSVPFLLGIAAAGTATLALGPALSSCRSPVVDCYTSPGGFGAKYILQSPPTGTCSEALTKELTELRGDIVGFQSYVEDHYGRNPETDPSTLAVQTNTLGTTARRYASRKTDGGEPAVDKASPLYSLGVFDRPTIDENDFCSVTKLERAAQDLPGAVGIPADPARDAGPQPPLPPISLAYEWSNLRVNLTPEINGSQVEAMLTFTKNGCSATYKVLAVYPYVQCLDKDKNPSQALCSPEPQPDAGRSVGSGLRFPTVCDPVLGFCVYDGDAFP
jgi:hypothetical protein